MLEGEENHVMMSTLTIIFQSKLESMAQDFALFCRQSQGFGWGREVVGMRRLLVTYLCLATVSFLFACDFFIRISFWGTYAVTSSPLLIQLQSHCCFSIF